MLEKRLNKAVALEMPGALAALKDSLEEADTYPNCGQPWRSCEHEW